MNGKTQFEADIERFLISDLKVMLISGTHQYKKHKFVLAIIHKKYKKAKILFRTIALQNITNEDFLGFAGLKKQPRAGDIFSLGNNVCTADSFSKTTWHKSRRDYDFSILYPIDALIRNNDFKAIEDLIERTSGKVFLVTWTDVNYDLSKIKQKFADVSVIYDALEEDEAYHNRVLDLSKRF